MCTENDRTNSSDNKLEIICVGLKQSVLTAMSSSVMYLKLNNENRFRNDDVVHVKTFCIIANRINYFWSVMVKVSMTESLYAYIPCQAYYELTV